LLAGVANYVGVAVEVQAREEIPSVEELRLKREETKICSIKMY
jgi:hypothetical protein